VTGWSRDDQGRIGLEEVVRGWRPPSSSATSTQAGAFTEAVVRAMAAGCERPIILPLSNPTRLCEAKPADLLRWTDGQALVATGSPFDPVTHDKVTYVIGRPTTPSSFPGLGLGAIVARASRMTDHMIFAAAEAGGRPRRRHHPRRSLLPQINDVRETSVAVATAVAQAAADDGVARAPPRSDLEAQVRPARCGARLRPVRPA